MAPKLDTPSPGHVVRVWHAGLPVIAGASLLEGARARRDGGPRQERLTQLTGAASAFAANDTLTVDGTTLTFVAGTAGANQISRSVEVNAPAAADDAPYVTGVRLNGKAYGATALPQSFATGGGNLDVSLSTQPDTTWGSAAKDAPPSYQTGQDSAIGLLNPSAQNGQEVVTAGDSVPVKVGASVVQGRCTPLRASSCFTK